MVPSPSGGSPSSPLRGLLLSAALARAALLLFGAWQDAHMKVKFTDIDYEVYTDAARFFSAGGSPYDRSTYRYTPLLAMLLLPNITIQKEFGKVLFLTADLLVAWLIWRLLGARGLLAPRQRALCVSVWLFNPLTATISARGNGEALVTCMMLGTLALLHQGMPAMAGAVFGLAVHWRLYPIIYALSLVRHLALRGLHNQKSEVESAGGRLQRWLTSGPLGAVVSRDGVVLGMAAASTFFALTWWCFARFGHAFLDEAMLYHARRSDPRHNFSPFFYPAYLEWPGGGAFDEHGGAGAPPAFAAAVAGMLLDKGFAVAQLVTQIGVAWRFAGDLPACWLLQTVAFVAFNRVSVWRRRVAGLQ
jgi:GPI mannosyltransferase 1 subunit M